MIIENIGYLNIDAPSENNSISGSFFDYLNLTEGYRIYMTLSLFGGKYIFDDILDGGIRITGITGSVLLIIFHG